MNTDALRKQVGRLSWVHTIDLGNGVVTPGAWKPNSMILQVLNGIDFRGKSVLDIGCWDGLWSFEAERRGAATVVAVDDLSQRTLNDQATFRLAHEALGSKVEYHPDVSVYELADRLAQRDFDIVLFLGVYYHLKYPLWAFSQVRRLTANGGLMLTEGPVLPSRRRSYAEFFYGRIRKNDRSHWFIPSRLCLREWIECSFFRVRQVVTRPWATHLGPLYAAKDLARRMLGRPRTAVYRCVFVSEAVVRSDPGYAFPDEQLEAYDSNTYSRGAPPGTTAATPPTTELGRS